MFALSARRGCSVDSRCFRIPQPELLLLSFPTAKSACTQKGYFNFELKSALGKQLPNYLKVGGQSRSLNPKSSSAASFSGRLARSAFARLGAPKALGLRRPFYEWRSRDRRHDLVKDEACLKAAEVLQLRRPLIDSLAATCTYGPRFLVPGLRVIG